MPPKWIEKAWERYRSDLATAAKHTPFGLDETGATRMIGVVAVWASRYHARRNALEGIRGADRVLADLLEERNREADRGYPGFPSFPADVLPFVEGPAMTIRTGVGARDPHPHGPSFRRVWLEGLERGGGSEEEAVRAVLAWARAPASPRGDPPKKALFGEEVEWSRTEDLVHPFAAEVGGQRWQLRLEDFPEELPWTLLVDGAPAGAFAEWPKAWSRGARPRPRTRVVIAGEAAARWPQRYEAGEREAVWAELVSLGPDVRAEPHLAPAREVARLTMRRAAHDLDLLIPRLQALGYRFGQGERRPSASSFAVGGPGGRVETVSMADLLGRIPGGAALKGMLDAISAPRPPPAPDLRAPPHPKAAKGIAAAARRGLVLPLSLEAWITEVGSVDLTGLHPVLCPEGRALDPLMVHPWASDWDEALEEAREEWKETEAPVELPISWLPEDKADLARGEDLQVDAGVAFEVPEPAADAVLKRGGGLTFVAWLRRSLTFGGFPGWEGEKARPPELAAVVEGFVGL